MHARVQLSNTGIVSNFKTPSEPPFTLWFLRRTRLSLSTTLREPGVEDEVEHGQVQTLSDILPNSVAAQPTPHSDFIFRCSSAHVTSQSPISAPRVSSTGGSRDTRDRQGRLRRRRETEGSNLTKRRFQETDSQQCPVNGVKAEGGTCSTLTSKR